LYSVALQAFKLNYQISSAPCGKYQGFAVLVYCVAATCIQSNNIFGNEKCALYFKKWECFQQHSEKGALQQFSNREEKSCIPHALMEPHSFKTTSWKGQWW